jgi:hypothetical protein
MIIHHSEVAYFNCKIFFELKKTQVDLKIRIRLLKIITGVCKVKLINVYLYRYIDIFILVHEYLCVYDIHLH